MKLMKALAVTAFTSMGSLFASATDDLKLFYIQIGGEMEHSLVEQHDMRLCVARSIEETHEFLKATTPHWSNLHIDFYKEMKIVDGYAVSFSDQPAINNAQLFFINMGWYQDDQELEQHQNLFLVTEQKSYKAASDVKKRAYSAIESEERKIRHPDNINAADSVGGVVIDNMLNVENYILKSTPGLHLHLTQTEEVIINPWKHGYFPLTKEDDSETDSGSDSVS